MLFPASHVDSTEFGANHIYVRDWKGHGYDIQLHILKA